MNNADMLSLIPGARLTCKETGEVVEVVYARPHEGDVMTVIVAPALYSAFAVETDEVVPVGEIMTVDGGPALVLAGYISEPPAVRVVTRQLSANPELVHIITMHNAFKWLVG